MKIKVILKILGRKKKKKKEEQLNKKDKKFTLLDHEQRWFNDTQGGREYDSDEDFKKTVKTHT